MENQSNSFLIYGAYGYTGEIATRLAVSKGHRPILAGRDEKKLKSLAEALNLEYHCFDLSETSKLESVLKKVKVVLHCAGPYSMTAKQMVEACMKMKVHYLDITGELEVFEWIATQGKAAKEAGISLIPGVGFDVVPTDCLASYLKKQLPDAASLELGIQAIGEISRGTMLTAVENIDKGGMIREDGQLKRTPLGSKTRMLPVRGKEVLGVSIPWGDVSTAFYSTSIPNIVVYAAADKKMLSNLKMGRNLGWLLGLGFVQSFLKKRIRKKVTGPSETHRENSRSFVWGEVANAKGEKKSAFIETSEGYKLTAESAVLATEKVLAGNIPIGFQTPSLAFGMDFILQIKDTVREDLE